MAAAHPTALEKLKGTLVYAWNWPLVEGAHYSPEDRKAFENRSSNYIAYTSAAVGSALVFTSPPAWIVLAAVTVGVISAHYAAGAVTALRR